MYERHANTDEEDSDSDIEDNIRLSDTVTMFPKMKLNEHRKVVAGEICSNLVENRPCVIKFDPDQIVKERTALKKLSGYSNIVCLMESGTFHDEFVNISYIVLEKCHELNLENYVTIKPHTVEPIYDINRGLKFCKQIINGMKFVHENLIIHKDLKPSNILLCHDLENVKIADFGSSQEVKLSSSKARCPGTFGTLGYRPPESLLERSFVTLKSDIFSLGVLFYFLLSKGKSPFGPESDKWDHNTQSDVIDISRLLVPNPVATEHLIKSMLNKEHRGRPSIAKVACHPCWNGDEQDLDFEYFEEELDDDDDDIEVGGGMQVEADFDEFRRTVDYFFNDKEKRQAKSKRVTSQDIREEDSGNGTSGKIQVATMFPSNAADPYNGLVWGPWRILRWQGTGEDQRSIIAQDYMQQLMGLAELGTIPDNVVSGLGLNAGRYLTDSEISSVRPVYLSATKTLHRRIGQLFYGSHNILQQSSQSWLQGNQVIVIRVAILLAPNDPFAVKRQIKQRVNYDYPALHDCPEEDEPPSL